MSADTVTLVINLVLALAITANLYSMWRLVCVSRAHKQRMAVLNACATLEELEAVRNGPNYEQHIRRLMRFEDGFKLYGAVGDRARRKFKQEKRA